MDCLRAIKPVCDEAEILFHELQITYRIDALNSDSSVASKAFDFMMEVHQRRIKLSWTQVCELGRSPGKDKSSKKQ